MICYNSIHETCISVPCKSQVKEGQLCKFDLSMGVRPASFGETPDGLVKYVRNGNATVQIHGLVTVPYTCEDYAVGKNNLVCDDTGFGVQLGGSEDKFMVITANHIDHTVTFMLG